MYKVLYLIREIIFLRCKQARKRSRRGVYLLPSSIGTIRIQMASTCGCFAFLTLCPWLFLGDLS